MKLPAAAALAIVLSLPAFGATLVKSDDFAGVTLNYKVILPKDYDAA